jgi:hypothetical protein
MSREDRLRENRQFSTLLESWRIGNIPLNDPMSNDQCPMTNRRRCLKTLVIGHLTLVIAAHSFTGIKIKI